MLLLVSFSPLHAKPSLSFVHSVTREERAEEIRRTDYAALRAWQRTQVFAVAWPRERRVDLNGDGTEERFLLFSEHAHFATYSIFTRQHGRWIYVGEAGWGERMRVLRAQQRGWHEFAIEVSSSRNALSRETYSWDIKARTYLHKSSETIRPPDIDDP